MNLNQQDVATSAFAERANHRWLVLLVSTALAAAPWPTSAQGITSLSDITYQDDAYASREMPKRGFTLTHSDTRDQRSYQYWWNGAGSTCAQLKLERGKVTDIKRVDETDCNQRASASGGGMSQGAQAALAAAAILGVAALAHKSHERDKDRAQQSAQDTAEFDRGYRDGMYHQGYHNYNNAQSYGEGYRRGSEKRDAETSYRSDRGYHRGDAPYSTVQDLVGARGSSAESDLQGRGFVSRGGYKQDDRAMSTWWNGRTRQCVSMTVRQGRVDRMESIAEGNCT